MELCGRCRGDGIAYDDRNGWFGDCPDCGGSGYIDPYLVDEWYEEDGEEDFEDEFERALGDCSMMDDGFCGQAGSEYCEFECLIRRMMESEDDA